MRDLKALDPQALVLGPTKEQETFDPDNQKFLRNIQQRGRHAMIAESLTRIHRDFDIFLEEKVDLDWEEQRRRIFQHFGLAQKDDNTGDGRGTFGHSVRQSKQYGATSSYTAPGVTHRSVFGRSGMEKSVIGVPSTRTASHRFFDAPMERSDASSTQSSDLHFLREKMSRYADKVQLLNSARLQAHTFPVLHEFSEVESHVGGDVS